MMHEGDLNKAQGHPRSPTHTHTQSHMHAHTLKHSHTLFMQEKKYINICITKQYKGLSVVKYVFCRIKMCWRIRVGRHFPYVCKTISPFAFNKTSFPHLLKIFPWFNGIWGTGLYLCTQKVFFHLLKSLFSKWKPKIWRATWSRCH